MPTPSKPADVIRMEKKSHRTKQELASRKQSEVELLTGQTIKESQEVKADEQAHKEFRRVVKLLKEIGKNDDLYGAQINRYCLTYSRYLNLLKDEERLQNFMNDPDMDAKTYIMYQEALLATRREIRATQKILSDTEKENVMTVAASLRSIPKKPEAKKSPLMEALASGN